VHVVLHSFVVGSHKRLFGHAAGSPATHAPWLLHELVVSSVFPVPEQALPQLVVDPAYVHVAPFVPLQEPPQGATPEFMQAGRVPTGGPVTGEQVPSLPITLHAWHCSPQAPLQQNPSTQSPDAHSWAAPHICPLACCAMQVWAPEQ
jgi:hypothetical protein